MAVGVRTVSRQWHETVSFNESTSFDSNAPWTPVLYRLHRIDLVHSFALCSRLTDSIQKMLVLRHAQRKFFT